MNDYQETFVKDLNETEKRRVFDRLRAESIYLSSKSVGIQFQIDPVNQRLIAIYQMDKPEVKHLIEEIDKYHREIYDYLEDQILNEDLIQ